MPITRQHQEASAMKIPIMWRGRIYITSSDQRAGFYFLWPGGYKEMSSIFADQYSDLVYESKCGGKWGGGGEVAGSQPMSTAVHITWHWAQVNLEIYLQI